MVKFNASYSLKRFAQLAEIFRNSIDPVPESNPLKKPVLILGMEVENLSTRMEQRFEELNYRISGFLGDSKENSASREFEDMMFLRACGIFKNEKLKLRQELFYQTPAKNGIGTVPHKSNQEIDILGLHPPRIIEASLCLREKDILNITDKKFLLLNSNLVHCNYYDIKAHIWTLWIDEQNKELLKQKAAEENIEIIHGDDLFLIDGKSIFGEN